MNTRRTTATQATANNAGSGSGSSHMLRRKPGLVLAVMLSLARDSAHVPGLARHTPPHTSLHAHASASPHPRTPLCTTHARVEWEANPDMLLEREETDADVDELADELEAELEEPELELDVMEALELEKAELEAEALELEATELADELADKLELDADALDSDE
ncbi:hypothetical protein B0H13DRAFT_2327018 [Mycena leptocephala]|nr:hypothetical protein B0H13DRAFT_2327018 [Mycena leptocephala]